VIQWVQLTPSVLSNRSGAEHCIQNCNEGRRDAQPSFCGLEVIKDAF